MGNKQAFLVVPLLLLLALLFGGALPAPGGVTRGFSVKSFSPEGLADGPVQILVEFSSDAAASGDVDRDLRPGELPLVFSPPLGGRGRWLGPSTFVYYPSGGRLTPATRYAVTLNERLSDLAGNRLTGKRAFEMRTSPLAFRGVRQVDFDVASGFISYELTFSQPVKASRLAGFLSVRDGRGQKVPFSMDAAVFSERVWIQVNAGDGSPVTIAVEKGMTGESGPLGLERAQGVRLKRDLSLTVRRVEAKSDLDGGWIELETSAPLDIARAPAFIELSGTEAKDLFVESAWGNVTHIRGSFRPRDRVTLTLRKGLPSAGGPALGEEWERALIVPDMEPQLRFTEQGRFLSPAGERLLMPLESVNIERLRVRVKRVYDNNVPVVMAEDWPYYPSSFSESVFDEIYTIQGDVNGRTERAIDLRRAAGGRRGLFLIEAASERGWPSRSCVVNVTDIAGSLRLGPEGALVWATSLSTGKPLRDVAVTIWSASNQPLAEGRTNAEGIWEAKRDEPWLNSLRPAFATLRLGEDTAVLRLDSNLWDLSGLDLSGRPYPGRGYQALCYAPRGVFRPGESVPVQFLLRDETLSLKEPFPVQVVVFTPTGREWRRYAPMLSEMGMGSVLVRLSDAAQTGLWRAEVRIPGDDRAVGSARFAVEDFAPPRIRVKAAADREVLTSNDEGTLRVEARYLFGAPADGLNYEAELMIIPRKYFHPDWPNFTFADDRLAFEAESIPLGSGTLSPEGEAELRFRVGALNPPSFLDAVFRVGVMEEGGRWVYDTATIPYYPRPLLLGIEGPGGTPAANAKLPFRVAAIDREGRPAALRRVTTETFRVSRRPQVMSRGGRASSETREELVSIEKGELALVNGAASLDLVMGSEGAYVFAVTDEGTGASASYRFYVYNPAWTAGDAQATLPERLDVTLDRALYKPGERAKARVRGAFDGTVLLTVETDRVLYSATAEAKEGGVEIPFKVTEEMSPNAWVTAQLVRPVAEADEWTGHRASGAVPLSVDCSPKRLGVSMKLPERLRPRAKNDFSLQLTDASGRGVAGEVSLMLVDEGVLALTRYAPPNPFDFYTARRALGMQAFDIYDQLLPLRRKVPPLLTPGGGEGEDMAAALYKAALSPVRADRFKVLTLHKRVRTDARGRADFSFVLPEFSGGARLMAVAASAGAFGAFEEGFTVAREVVSELSLPRAAAPGDSFTAQLQLFNRSEVSQDVRYELALSGPLRAEPSSGEASLASGDGGTLTIPIRMTATGDSGAARVELTTRYAGRAVLQTIELPVRPPYPRVSRTGSFALMPGESRTLALPGGWMPGTRRGVLAASGLPSVQIADLARFLVEYPYGCLEQTVSSGWALLAQPGLVRNLDPSLATERQVAAALDERLRRIQAMQLYNGAFMSWPGAFAGDGAYAAWNSVYAAHFLSACEAAGVALPREMLGLARAYLSELIAIAPSAPGGPPFAAELTLRAYACYVLSLGKDRPPLAWMSYLRDNLPAMTPSGRIFLAAALARAGRKEEARAMLTEDAPAIDGYEPAQREERNLDSDLRTLGLHLMAWNEVDPTAPAAAAAAANVLTALRATERVTTQEAAFALASLGHFFLYHTESGKPEIASSPASLLGGASGDVRRGRLPDGLASVRLTNGGDGRGFVSWSVDGVPLTPPAPADRGLRVRVRYDDSQGKPLKLDAVAQGQKVVGTIDLEALGGVSRNIVVSLPLAAGLEIENPRLTGNASDGSAERGDVRQEMRDDRLLLFLDSLNGPFTWRFTMRAVTPGSFTLPPISAEGMYSPAVGSITAPSRITILPAGR